MRGGGSVSLKSLDVTTTVKGNTNYCTWDLTAIPNYKNLVLWETLFPELPAWVAWIRSNVTEVISSEYIYDASTGVLKYSCDHNVKYGTDPAPNMDLTVHYIA